MKEKTAEILVEAAEKLGLHGARPYDGLYAGRGMGGKGTHGVIFEDMNAVIAAAAQGAIISAQDATPEYDDTDFVEDMARIRSDDMGRDVIVY